MTLRPLMALFVTCLISLGLQCVSHNKSKRISVAQARAADQPGEPSQARIREPRGYLDYSTFKALAALVPEAPHARLVAGLTDAGYELWSKGQMRLPAANYFLEGDFDGDGRLDSALLLEGGPRRYLLIAAREDEQWIRTALFLIRKESQLDWDGKTLKLESPEAFIDWTGKEYSLKRGPLELYQHSYSVSDFAGVMIKLTYIGDQSGPYPGLLVSSYYKPTDLSAFRPLRRAGVHYGNDDLGALWHLTVSPEQVRDLVRMVRSIQNIDQAERRAGVESGLSHSLMILDSWSAHTPNAFEAVLTFEETVSLLRTAATNLEGKDPAAARLLREYLKLFDG